MGQFIEVEREGGVRILTLAAPDRRNAISMEMREQLLAALDAALADDRNRVIILTGQGAHFCSGGDLRAAHDAPPSPESTARKIAVLQDIVRRITSNKPVLAAVEGAAFGAGMALACACDFVIGSADARFCASFVRVGLSADTGMTWTLPQRVGVVRSRQLLITGRIVEAAEALAIGLADELVPAGRALAKARERAEEICRLAPLSIAAVKSTLNAFPYTLQTALETEMGHQLRLSVSADYREGRTAFLEKRVANFTGA